MVQSAGEAGIDHLIDSYRYFRRSHEQRFLDSAVERIRELDARLRGTRLSHHEAELLISSCRNLLVTVEVAARESRDDMFSTVARQHIEARRSVIPPTLSEGEWYENPFLARRDRDSRDPDEDITPENYEVL